MMQQGERLFAQYGCLNCHAMNGEGRGPSLQNVFGHPLQLAGGRTVIADEPYLRESILNPNAKVAQGYKRDVMPVYEGQIGEDGLLPLIVYIKGLSVPQSAKSTAAIKPANQQ
jgi:cytochrome c oxidase subunit 2